MQSHPPGPETVAAPLPGRARVDRVPRRRKGMMAVAGGGDDGTTGLLGGGRARKDDPRIEAAGAVDEASSAVGLAKALTQDSRLSLLLFILGRFEEQRAGVTAKMARS